MEKYGIFKASNPEIMVDEKDALSKNWSHESKNVAVYAIQGKRSRMEDRYVVNTNINDTGVSLFAIFDGHAGEFAADYATTHLMTNLMNKIVEIKKLVNEKKSGSYEETKVVVSNIPDSKFKPRTFADVCANRSLLNINHKKQKQDSLNLTKDKTPLKNAANVIINPSSYLLKDGSINFSKLLIDEVLAADKLLVEAAKLTLNVTGSTALIVLVENSTMYVANVGDSRGVMCDKKGKAIPISFDHKPQQKREKKRIKKAGGFILFNGVWRVAGILAMSRALGNYPLKENHFVIANPDVLTFDLSHHDPQFIILASDGVWDKVTNEEAVECVKNHIDDSFHGAKYLTLQSFEKGSQDNITVLVIKFPPIWNKKSQKVNNAGGIHKIYIQITQ